MLEKQYHSWHDASVLFLSVVVALHGMSFARAGLAIGHDGAMEAFKDVIEDWIGHFFEYLFLCGVHIEDAIIHEWYFFCACVFDDKLCIFVDSM